MWRGDAVAASSESGERYPCGGLDGRRMQWAVSSSTGVCTVEQTPLMEIRNMRDYGGKAPSNEPGDGAPWCARKTGEPTNHVCGGRAVQSPDGVSGAHPPRSSAKPPHGAFGSKNPSQRPRHRVRARVTTGFASAIGAANTALFLLNPLACASRKSLQRLDAIGDVVGPLLDRQQPVILEQLPWVSARVARDAFERLVCVHAEPLLAGFLLAFDERANLSFPQ